MASDAGVNCHVDRWECVCVCEFVFWENRNAAVASESTAMWTGGCVYLCKWTCVNVRACMRAGVCVFFCRWVCVWGCDEKVKVDCIYFT